MKAMKQSNNFQFSIFNFQFIILLCTMMLSSCVNDIPYDAGIGAPRLVLNALLLPDSTLTATVSRTAHFLDTEDPQRLADATVIATVNGEEHQLIYVAATENYHSSCTLHAGDEVTLTATHAIGTATATAQVMKSIPLTVAHTAMQPFTNPGDPVSLATLNDVDSAMLVSLHIDDPADEPNYYRLTVDYYGTYLVRYPESIYNTSSASHTADESGFFVSQEGFYPHYLFTESSSRLIIDSESMSQLLGGLLYLTSSNSIIFTDEQLRSTGEPIIDFLMLMESPRSSSNDMYNPDYDWGYDDDWTNGFIFPADTISRVTYHRHFMLESLSEQYYRYLKSVSSYDQLGGIFVGEPTSVHTNIRGGIGIVGSYSGMTCSDSLEYVFVK